MPRSERERREDLVPATERAAPAAAAVAPMPAAVLRMQALVGNRATTDVLARAPTADQSSVSVDGLGTYKVYSFTRASNTSLSVSLDPGRDAAKLFAAAAQGTPIKSATLTHAAHTVTLSEVLIAGVQNGGGQEPVTVVEFDAARIEFH
jgi:hypothetical protein